MSPPIDGIPAGNSPDWGKTQVNTAGKLAPVGNPTMWGQQLTQPIVADSVQQRYTTPQILSCGAKDAYARPWTLAGTLSFPPSLAGMPNPGSGAALALDQWCCFLNVVMGVGQTQITHNIDLRETIAIQAPFYASFNDMAFNGSLPDPSLNDTYPFVIGADALIGNTLQAQIIIIERLAPSVQVPALIQFKASLICTPFAAGTEL